MMDTSYKGIYKGGGELRRNLWWWFDKMYMMTDGNEKWTQISMPHKGFSNLRKEIVSTVWTPMPTAADI
jgi:hypothetical protein